MWTFLRRRTLTQWIIAAMFIGVAIGIAFPEFARSLLPISTAFVRIIKSIIVPLIFGTLVVGIAGHGDDMKRVGRLALKSIIYFEIVTTLALFIGLLAVNIIKPGLGVTPTATAATIPAASEPVTFATVLEHIVPQSFFDAAARNEMLQIVFWSVLFAIGLTQVRGRSKETMLGFCEAVAEVMFKFTGIVMKFAPIGIGAAIAVTVSKSGLGVLRNLGILVLSLYGALVAFVLLVLVPVMIAARVPIGRFLRAVREPWLIAFTTASSEAALPLAMERMEALGVPRRIVAFAVSAIAPAAIILTIGLVDVAHGQYFLPNSIVEKTHLLSSTILGAVIPDLRWMWTNLSSDPFMLAVIGFGVIAVAQGVRLRGVWVAWLIATFFQATYAQFGWYERYQAYLLIAGVLLALRSAPEMRLFQVRSRQVIAVAAMLLLLPLVKYWNIVGGPNAAANQFSQQHQMAQFLSRYYDGKTMMANDIGHVTWLHSGGLVDMWALGSFDVLAAQRNGYYNATFMTALAAQRHVAAVAEYSPSFDFLVPHGFAKVATWHLRDAGDPRWQAIVFWAPAADAPAMRSHMREFIATMSQDRVVAQID